MRDTAVNFKQTCKAYLFRDKGLSSNTILALLVFLACITVPKTAFSYVMVDFLFEFGSQGKEPGMFREPQALALDRLGDVYVVDTNNHRVQVFGPSGDFLRKWGKEGSGTGEFDAPSGIAIGNDRVYIADSDNHRIQIFDTQGNHIGSFGSKGSGQKEFRKPKGLVWWNNLLYVADKGNDRIQVFTGDGIFLYQLSPEKTGSLSLEGPYSMAVDQFGNIYVIGKNNRIDIFSQKGKPRGGVNGDAVTLGPDGIYIANKSRIFRFTHDSSLKQFFTSGANNEIRVSGPEESSSGVFREISAIAINELRNLYVLSSKQGTISVFRTKAEPVDFEPEKMPSGVAFYRDIPIASNIVLSHFNDTVFFFDMEKEKILPLNELGSGPDPGKGKISSSAGAQGNIWVVNTEKHCLHNFDSSGKLIGTVGGKGSRDGQFSSPADIAVHNNYLYVADAGNARIQMLDREGKYINSFGNQQRDKGNISKPVAITFDKNNNLYVVDEELNKVVKMDSAGSFVREFGNEGEEDGQFRKPRGIFVVNEEVYVLDSGNNRVQIFDADGMFLRKFASEGKGIGEFKRPSAMYIDNLYNLYVLDRRNDRVQNLKLLLTPSAPKALRADGMIKEVKITWLPSPEPHVAAYTIFRRQKGNADFEEVGKVDGTASYSKFAFFDKNLKSKATFYYTVKAVSRTGNQSLMSNMVEATTKSLVPSKPKLVKTDVGQREIFMEWAPSPESYADHYVVMKNNETWKSYLEVNNTKSLSFKDTNLAPNTVYKYMLVAVGIEDDRSEPLTFELTTLKLPAIEILGAETGDIFSNNYKYYEEHPLGKIIIKNNRENNLAGIKISLMARDYMDYPTEALIDNIKAGETLEIPLKAVFNNRLLALTENSAVPAEIEVSYFEDKEVKTVTISKSLDVFEKHALRWDKTEKAAVFVTPKDPLLLQLAAASVAGYNNNDLILSKSLIQAKAVFEAMGVMGITYMQDPNNPYQQVSKKAARVDFIQYPRDTLKRKAGDCDDLVVLYASILEGLGINTALLTYPGHIFLMFDASVGLDSRENFAFPPEDYVTLRKTIWIPVEVTLVGNAFNIAWKKGLDQYREWQGRGLQIVEMTDAWKEFKPATLGYEDMSIEMIDPARIEAAFPGETESLRQRSLNYLVSLLLSGPVTANSLDQLGTLYGENRMYSEAMATFEKYIALNGEDATVLNNMGNLYFLQANYKNAEKSYLKALRYDPTDTGILINCVRLYLKLNNMEKARKFFASAAEIDPEVSSKYYYLSPKLKR